MSNSEPDYSTYTYKDLLDVRQNIDRDKFPERAKAVDKLISEKAAEQPASNREYSVGEKTILALVGG